MTEPLWQNDEFKVFDNCLMLKTENWQGPGMMREWIEDKPELLFEMIEAIFSKNPDLLYDAFLHLATYWDLKVDFDELRKIREEMKEASNA